MVFCGKKQVAREFVLLRSGSSTQKKNHTAICEKIKVIIANRTQCSLYSCFVIWLIYQLILFWDRHIVTEEDIRQAAAIEIRMASKAITPSNSAEMVQAHKDTFGVRKNWILTKSPTITEVITRYPRYKDLTIQVVR